MSEATIPSRGPSHPLPRPLGRVLGRIGVRLRLASLIRGLGTTAMVLALLAALGMAADFLRDLPQPVRWAIWGAWLAAGGFVLIATTLRPLLRRFGTFDLAAAAEQGHPELGEQITGAVALLGAGAPHGSPELIAELADRAARSCRTLQPAGSVSWSRSGRRLALGLLAVGVVAAPPLLRPDPFGALARRFLMPWADIDRVSRIVLSVAPGDKVIAAGSDLTITAEARPMLAVGFGPAPEAAWLEWSDEAGTVVQRIAMESAQPAQSPDQSDASVHRFTLTMPRLSHSMAYRVTSGDAASRRYRVTAMEPPSIASITATVEPPAYTKRPSIVARDPARIEAFEGSRVTLDITPDRPVRAIEVGWPAEAGKPAAATTAALADGGRKGSFSAIARESGPYDLSMDDEHGIRSRAEKSRMVVVQPDAPPTVTVRGDEGAKEANPHDTVTVAFMARDDVAVESVELHHEIRHGGSQSAEPETGHREVKATGLGTRASRGVAALPLASMGVKPGDSLTYRLRVADNRPAPRGPNVTWSSARELTIVAGAEPIASRVARLRRSAIQAALDALKKDVASGRQEAERLRETADAARRGEGRWDAGRRRAVEEREKTLRDLIERIKQLARSLGEDPATAPMARPARQIAELEAESTRAMLERARQEQDPARLTDDLRQAGNRLAAVGERLDDLQRKLETQDQNTARRGKLHELADRQQRLADEAAAAPKGRVELDRLQARQNAVRNELDGLVRQTPNLRGALLEAEAREADRLARAARDLAGRQREETRRASDPAQHAAELKALADAQRALEDDARRFALDVNPTLAENGRGQLNVEEIRQAVEPIERGDVDQARQRLESAENELRKLSRDIEDLPTDPKSLAYRLVRRQDALNGDLADAQNQLREKDKLNKDEQDALADRLKALGRRQEAIARLAASIKPPERPLSRGRFPEHAAREAADKTRRAAEAFAQPTAQVLEERKNEARQALDRFANELPDWWRRTEPTRQKFDEARRATYELFNQVQQHLRETEPRHDHPVTAAKAAEELANRLGDAPDRLANAIKALKEMEPDPRAEPQRARAVRGAESMERVLRDLRDASKREAARTALPAAEARSHATMDRLEQKMNAETPPDDRAAELAQDQHAIVGRLAGARADEAPAARAEAAEAQRRLANALRDLNAPDAALDQAEAVRLADRAAHALAEPGAKPADIDAARSAARAVDELASRLSGRRSDRDQAAALARAERGLNEPGALAAHVAAARRQKVIAAELALLPVDKKEEAAGRLARAAELADRAEQPDDDQAGSSRPDPSALAEARTRAAEALDAVAARASRTEPKPPATRTDPRPAADPDLPLKPAHAEAARDLVRRERQLREQFLAMLGRHVEPQQAIQAQAADLGRELMELRDRIRPISERGPYPAYQAAYQLRTDAPQSMGQAAKHLAQAQAPYARDAQRRASESVERGAQHAEDLAAALCAERLAMAGAAPTPANAAGGEHPPLGEAREAVTRAASQLDQARESGQAAPTLPAAREAMSQAARDLMAAAQAAESGADAAGLAEAEADASDEPTGRSSHPPQGSPTDAKTQPGQAAETDLAELKEAIRRGTGRNWGELPGHLRTEILQSARGRYRDDYARLIQLYFREIAAGAADKPASSPK